VEGSDFFLVAETKAKFNSTFLLLGFITKVIGDYFKISIHSETIITIHYLFRPK